MNNYYALKHLTKYLKNHIEGGEFLISYSPHKNVWELYVKINATHVRRVIFSTNSSETALFLDGDRSMKKSNVTTFFESLSEDKLINILLTDSDRFIKFLFQSEKSLLFQLFGNTPNVFLVENQIISEAFKASDKFESKPAPQPRPVSTVRKSPDEDSSAKQKIISLFPAFPRHLIHPVINHYDLKDKTTAKVEEAVSELIAAMETKPEFRVLEDGNLCLIPSQLLPLKNRKVFENVNDAIRYAYYQTSTERRLSSKIGSLRPKLEQAVKKHESAIQQLSEGDKGLERAEEYEQFGHILMSHAHEKRDMESGVVQFSDFYNENRPVNIPVKPGRSIAENAQRYYEKSTKAIRNVEESAKRLKVIQRETDELKSLLNSLNHVEKNYQFDEWYSEHEEDLRRLGILSKVQNEKALPFRKAEIDGFEIWIGKNAKSNDMLISAAHKEDVWLHARGVGGSHVVIRMGNRKDMPQKSTLRKAAAVAAWNSKARGSKLAPVIVTKRKYITKPKGAPPGAVKVQREDVEMVEPQKLS